MLGKKQEIKLNNEEANKSAEIVLKLQKEQIQSKNKRFVEEKGHPFSLNIEVMHRLF